MCFEDLVVPWYPKDNVFIPVSLLWKDKVRDWQHVSGMKDICKSTRDHYHTYLTVQRASILTYELNDKESVCRFQNCRTRWTVWLQETDIIYLEVPRVSESKAPFHVIYATCSWKKKKKKNEDGAKKSQTKYSISNFHNWHNVLSRHS